MGYRSDVAYIIKFKNKEDRDTFVDLMMAKDDPHITEAVKETLHGDEEGTVRFSAESVKWYDGYSDVDSHRQLLDTAVEIEGADYRFVRIGEDYEDIEIRSGGDGDHCLYELLDVARSIDKNW
jgi:hypothetical protein